MSRHVVTVGAVCAGLAIGVTLFTLARSGRAPAEPAGASASSPEPSRDISPSAATTPRPAPAAGSSTARRAPSAAAKAPRPSPVERAPDDTAPELGTLRIESDVPGAQVFIDRQFIGTAPLTAENLKPGTHQLNVSAEGFDGIARTIDVEPGPRDLTVRFREVRLDATLTVVHKHKLGACRGQLVATAKGLRYDTADKEDGFIVSLSDLESFRVDYQDKNLRIKLRKGREYNFTDPDGNADRLFTFHRDVERARQRLANGDF